MVMKAKNKSEEKKVEKIKVTTLLYGIGAFILTQQSK